MSFEYQMKVYETKIQNQLKKIAQFLQAVGTKNSNTSTFSFLVDARVPLLDLHLYQNMNYKHSLHQTIKHTQEGMQKYMMQHQQSPADRRLQEKKVLKE